MAKLKKVNYEFGMDKAPGYGMPFIFFSPLLNPIDRNEWIYTATQNNAALTGSIIHVTAKDLPGNKGTMEITL